uniref:NAD(P)-binding domain-containing protein n=1 Tax=Pseudictyota dubia TaxID=2749911 RepID=A0A7R9VY15_9STRA|mmetsp:Transcript_25768/g.48012  ORF Transcript_25768/g.48012 Transcript_25768/m.48012 type:complete len:297 (+) Transcript_25768:57-947(+)|eukprot:CAMPEP_0197433838 /NCGR_PEP_ID=MMETSP1175-20131217/1646_1 /TAXON_ID=1003142 /ORGANISM="Triceratium dubium, Strain CCMP147" /LENGTH=296 /DNA_ID=CAMNT_0042962343 /DNA_START=63 /DNA_END=953 /DNA_ORIENTATION=+
MASVLVLGATGYIGGGVARAARRAGFKVYAQTRSDAKASALAADELIPLVCDPTDADALKETVQECEFICECGGSMDAPRANSEAIVKAIGMCDKKGAKKMILYTSGILVLGPHPNEVCEEDMVKKSVIDWRYELENYLLGLEDVDCAVMRPGFVYGGNGGPLAGFFFGKPEEGKLVVPGSLEKTWSWVHVDDLGEAYVLAMMKRSVSAGRAYNIGEPYGPTYKEFRLAAAKLAGYEGDEIENPPATEGIDAFLDAGGWVVASGKRALEELGWCSKHTGVMAQLPIYYEAYKASQK